MRRLELTDRNCVVGGARLSRVSDTPRSDPVWHGPLIQLRLRAPASRLGPPDEIGRAVSFLADTRSGLVTGAAVSVNGGLYMG